MAKPVKKQSWSNIDSFGLIRGLGVWDAQYKKLQYVRRPFDTSIDVRDKIMRINDNPPSLTKQGLLNGICDEFGLTPYNVTTKTSFELSHNPLPSGALSVQDITVQYRQVGSSGAWINILPQVWGDTFEQYRTNNSGFIVWTQDNYATISGYKNFNYSTRLDVLQDIPDNQDIKVVYNVAYVDSDNVKQITQFTDMNNLSDPNDTRFQYRKPIEISPLSGIVIYNLNDIPSTVSGKMYTTEGRAKEFVYSIKDHFDKLYRHTWDSLTSNVTLWDIQDIFSSGEIPHFLDSYAPKTSGSSGFYSGYIGGVDYLSNALYLSDLVEIESDTQQWYLKIYPGKFYIDGIPYRMLEDPRSTGLVFVSGVANLPSGLARGMYTMLANSGYYQVGQTTPDATLSGFVFEDYWAPTGPLNSGSWNGVYRHRPYLNSSDGYQVTIATGEYNIDFKAGKIYLNSPNTTGTLIWDNAIVPSGRVVNYDVNPLNQQFINLQKFFLYLVNKE